MKTRVRSIDKSEVSIPLGIVVEKRKSTHPWGDWIWTPVSVILNARADAKIMTLWWSLEILAFERSKFLQDLHVTSSH